MNNLSEMYYNIQGRFSPMVEEKNGKLTKKHLMLISKVKNQHNGAMLQPYGHLYILKLTFALLSLSLRKVT